MNTVPSPTTDNNPRWFHPTPARLLIVLLAVEGLLLLSEQFQWFTFNEKKGWTVLIAIASLGVFLLLTLLWFVASLICRWRFQFSLRSLLVLTVAVAVPFSWLAVEMKKAREQREAVAAIEKVGAWVKYDDEETVFSLFPELLGLQELLGHDFFTSVREVWLNRERATDAELTQLQRLPHLEKLFFYNLWETDADLKYLTGMTQLRELYLSNSEITDAGLGHLKELTHLEQLYLHNTQVTDAGLEYIQGMTQLRELYLDKTHVTDVGLERLKGLVQLRDLHLNETQVTDKGVKELQQALPKCKIEH